MYCFNLAYLGPYVYDVVLFYFFAVTFYERLIMNQFVKVLIMGLLFMLASSFVLASEIVYSTTTDKEAINPVVVSGTIYVSPPVTVFRPVSYPINASKMSDAEFYKWATERNAKAQVIWQNKYDWAGSKYLDTKELVNTSESSATSTGTSSVSLIGATQGPGKWYSNTTNSSRIVPGRYLNPHYQHPGALTIVNPYYNPTK